MKKVSKKRKNPSEKEALSKIINHFCYLITKDIQTSKLSIDELRNFSEELIMLYNKLTS